MLREHKIVTCSADEAVATGITRGFPAARARSPARLASARRRRPARRRRRAASASRPSQDPYLRLTRTLQPGVVVTIEPGLYFIPSLLRPLLAKHEAKLNRAMIERLAPFGGIRIEDNVEVTADGHRNLTRDAFIAAAPRH